MDYYLSLSADEAKPKLTDASKLIAMSIDTEEERLLPELGLYALNENKGWGTNFHEGFKDLNPILNPEYKFLKKNKSRQDAEKLLNKIGKTISDKVEQEKLKIFMKLIREGHRLTNE